MQHKVGRRSAFGQFAGELKADDFRDQHGNGLAQHCGFSLDATNAPAQNGQTVDHGGVAVGAHERVGIGDFLAVFLFGPDGLGQIFEIDLMADAGSGRHNAEVFKRRLAPAQKFIALAVALIFLFDVLLERTRGAEIVDHYRVIDDQVDGDQRVDLLGVGAEICGGIAHGGQIDNGGHLRSAAGFPERP